MIVRKVYLLNAVYHGDHGAMAGERGYSVLFFPKIGVNLSAAITDIIKDSYEFNE